MNKIKISQAPALKISGFQRADGVLPKKKSQEFGEKHVTFGGAMKVLKSVDQIKKMLGKVKISEE